MQVKKTVKCDARLKEVFIEDGRMYESETGDAVDLMGLLDTIYGSTPFSILASSKSEAAEEISSPAEEFDPYVPDTDEG